MRTKLTKGAKTAVFIRQAADLWIEASEPNLST
jgi:hypothetical protein